MAATPAVGALMACATSGAAQPPPPSPTPPWIHSDTKTWDMATKLAVRGNVGWPTASYAATLRGAQRTLAGNDLPAVGTTGTFPVAADDPVATYDANPNTIRPHPFSYTLPTWPAPFDTPACLPMGPIGVLSNGVLLYNAVDAAGRDAFAHEVQDACGGHPDMSGTYHYHAASTCLEANGTAPYPVVGPGQAALAGYALDGFGIFVEKNATGRRLTNADLDVCHGRTSSVPWDGRLVLMYHYVATAAFPYTVGCFRGTGSGKAWDNH